MVHTRPDGPERSIPAKENPAVRSYLGSMTTITVLTDRAEQRPGTVSDVLDADGDNRIAVVDERRGVVALSLDAEARRQALVDRIAPDFTLPDIAGTERSFHEWGGTKRLIFAWSSW